MFKLWELFNANLNWDSNTVLDIEVSRENTEEHKMERVDAKKSTYRELDEKWWFYTVSCFVGNKVYLIEE